MAHTTFDRRPGPLGQKIARILHGAKIANTHEVAALAGTSIKAAWDALNKLRRKGLVEHEHGARQGPGYGSDPMVWWLSPIGVTHIVRGWGDARIKLETARRKAQTR